MNDMKKQVERAFEAINDASREYNRLINLGIIGNCGIGSAAVVTEGERKRHKAVLDETRLLKGRFEDYLTDVDITSPCERLPDDYQNHLDKPLSKAERLKILENERDWYLALDEDEKYQKKQGEK